MSVSENYAQARARAEAKYGFYKHVAVYVAVMALLVMINFLTSPDSNWSIWPLLGWGFAVALHGLRVFFGSTRNRIVDGLTEQEMRRTRNEGSDQTQ